MKKCPKCGELSGDNVNKCFNCFFDFKQLEEEILKKKEAQRNEVYSINDVYEYDVVSIVDSKTGAVDIDLLRSTLAYHGFEGWRLVNSFTNELGTESTSERWGDSTYGKNATIDQTILIFERCIKRYSK